MYVADRTAVQGVRQVYEQFELKLVKDAFRGDSAAFCRIVERYQDPVYNLCARYLLPADAEDMAQETFVRAFVHRERFDPNRPLLPWLLTIARRLCLDRLRARKRAPSTEAESAEVQDPGMFADDQLGAKQELALLDRALRKLPEGQREAIVHHHVDGLSYQEVASLLDVPIGTVMTWLHRGRARLKEQLALFTRQTVRAGNGGKP